MSKVAPVVGHAPERDELDPRQHGTQEWGTTDGRDIYCAHFEYVFHIPPS